MREILLTKGFVALVDDEDFERVNQYRWRKAPCKGNPPTYRAFTTMKVDGKPRTVNMSRFIMNAPPDVQVDHRNHKPFDNQKHNLRFATPTQNAQNKNSKSKHGYKGVSFSDCHFLRKPYFARVSDNGTVRHLGFFRTAEEAAKAYDEAAKKYHGEFACLNFPEKEFA